MSKPIDSIGLALGGGGMRGYAHIGVLYALEDAKLPINFIAGTSAGAFIGCLYALYKNASEVEKIAKSVNWRDLFGVDDLSFQTGFIRGNKAEAYLSNVLSDATFGDCKIPFKVIATDFQTGKKVEILEGNLAQAVMASMSFPLLFEPRKFKEMTLYDGGMSDPVPCDTCRAMNVDYVIGVNLDNQSCLIEKRRHPVFGLYSQAQRAIQNLQVNLAKECIKSADIVIEPPVGEIGILGLKEFLGKNVDKIIAQGEIEARKHILEIKKLQQ